MLVLVLTGGYMEPASNQTFARSEGLAVASFYLFTKGAFSSQPESMQVDADGLRQLSQAKLEAGFQGERDEFFSRTRRTFKAPP